eukprot:scaffold122207_cov35-Cyclotella_meneghiniana.AAC.1
MALDAARQDLLHYSNFARSAFQCEYSKLIVTLDPNSSQYLELEESTDYLFNDADRIHYNREMIYILSKKIKYDKEEYTKGVGCLPLMTTFQCESNSVLLKALMEELWVYTLGEEVKSRNKDTTVGGNTITTSSTAINNNYNGSSSSKLKLLKYTTEIMNKSTNTVNELIKKHYRKKSIKLHPDRVGEEYRPSFEKFTYAKDVLLKENGMVRIKYMMELVGNVYLYYGKGDMLDQAHVGWMGKNANVDNGGLNGGGGESKRREEEVKRLEGGLQHQCLRAPLVKIVNDTTTTSSTLQQQKQQQLRQQHCENDSTTVEVSIRVPKPMYEFYSRVRSISVVFTSTHGVIHTTTMNRADI